MPVPQFKEQVTKQKAPEVIVQQQNVIQVQQQNNVIPVQNQQNVMNPPQRMVRGGMYGYRGTAIQ